MFEVIVLAVVTLAVYIAACTFWPHAACRSCTGAGKFRSPSGKAWRRCRRCDGRGSRERLGSRIFH